MEDIEEHGDNLDVTKSYGTLPDLIPTDDMTADEDNEDQCVPPTMEGCDNVSSSGTCVYM